MASDVDLESAHASLESRVTKLMHAGPHVIPFVVGGSNDQSYPNAAALMNELGHGKVRTGKRNAGDAKLQGNHPTCPPLLQLRS